MPFSQTHLAAALSLMERPSIKEVFPWLLETEPRSAFLLGCIGPDARVVDGSSRENSHFFSIPRTDPRPIEVVVLEGCPSLQQAGGLDRSHAAFVAGYLAHLVMDVVWLEEIVMPYLFMDGYIWAKGHPRWEIYNVLMAYLEYQGGLNLPDSISDDLRQAQPHHWIDCLPDESLIRWRDHIAHLLPADNIDSINMLAQVSGMEGHDLLDIVASEDRMEEVAYSLVSHETIEGFLKQAEDASEKVIVTYLSSNDKKRQT